jgi:hypothetical protein
MKTLILLLALGAFPAAAQAQTAEVQTGTAHTLRSQGKSIVLDRQMSQTVNCHGDVDVKGKNLHFTLTGKIKNLTITGTGNRVSVAGRVEKIRYEGGNNRVLWLEEDNRQPPEVSGHGEGNETTER